MLAIYLSGTGNTKHCIELLASLIDKSALVLPLESKDILAQIQNNEYIIIGYPTQFSNAPYMVRDFIKSHKDVWQGKKIFCLATMGAFSGDGAGCTARLFKKYGAKILGGIHIKMPDSVCDSQLLKKSLEQNKEIVKKADSEIIATAEQIKLGKYPKHGISFWAHMVGLFGQRLWFYGKSTGYSDKLKVNKNCVGCGLCAKICPMQNIQIQNGVAVGSDKCTMCYRCVCSCPQKAITILGKEVVEQCRFDKYIK